MGEFVRYKVVAYQDQRLSKVYILSLERDGKIIDVAIQKADMKYYELDKLMETDTFIEAYIHDGNIWGWREA